MAKITGATNTQKMLLLSLAERWRLRFTEPQGWALFQPDRERPFANVPLEAIDCMTKAGWLTDSIVTRDQRYRPEKLLSAAGQRYAQKLIDANWAQTTNCERFAAASSFDPSSSTFGLQAWGV
jgi:hypothetical protein